jgi:dimethylaniline monooxygenase (N-oxide forming)
MDKVCIIGAGASGLSAAKVLHERGIAYDCFEMGSKLGGLWRYNNDNGRSPAYKSLHINTSKQRMAFSDFPFPADYPDYPHHSQIVAYFENYAQHFGIIDTITYNTCVQHVEPLAKGGYNVTLDNGETRQYRAVLVCNGHHWQPRLPVPPFAGSFNGKAIHSSEYDDPYAFHNQNVLVVGIGNSGVDIACDLVNAANNVYLSTRTGAHILPKYILGMPTDWLVNPLITRLPFFIQRALMQMTVFIGRGSQARYGVPKPDAPILHQHPTVSADLLHYVGHGKLRIKPNIKDLQGDSVLFEDGTNAAIDTIIYATGYNITFPFLDAEVINPENNDVSLYHLVVHPEYDGLYFIGLAQPLGAIMPITERQSLWVADLLQGKSQLPDKETMYGEINKHKHKIEQRYLKRPRHTIQVDFFPYMRDLQRAINQGKKQH